MTAKEDLRSTPHPSLSRRERVLLSAHEMFQIPTRNVQTPDGDGRTRRREASLFSRLLTAALFICFIFAELPLAAQVVDRGIAVDFAATQHARQGEPVDFSFRLSDTATHAPLVGSRPAAWLGLRRGAAGPKDCIPHAATYLAGDLFARAGVDFNSYFVVAMHD